MLNQSLFYMIRYFKPNTKSKGVVATPLGSRGRKNSLVAVGLTCATDAIIITVKEHNAFPQMHSNIYLSYDLILIE